MKRYPRHISIFEIAVVVILGLLLVISVIAQLFYSGRMLLLITIILACMMWFLLQLLTPSSYVFEEEFLVLTNPKPLPSKRIPYTAVVKYDPMGTFLLSRIDIDTIEVILSYRPAGGGRKKSVSCHPKNVTEFVKTLQEKCPNLEYDS